ncbi:MAG: hypothetical protein P8P66_05275 [Paracoccaceae bacterium]|nr:hypothetical protein [Paracoccaceae bacterium]
MQILKIFRIAVLCVVFFFFCMIVVVTVLESWSPGVQMIFAFITPGILVWWFERWLSSAPQAKAQFVESDQNSKYRVPAFETGSVQREDKKS